MKCWMTFCKYKVETFGVHISSGTKYEWCAYHIPFPGNIYIGFKTPEERDDYLVEKAL